MPDLTVSNAIDTFMQSADQAAARTALSIPPLSVTTNTAKLALTDIKYGQEVIVTNEAGRLEKFVGTGTYAGNAAVTSFLAAGSSNVNLNGSFAWNGLGWQRSTGGSSYIRWEKWANTWRLREYDGEESSSALISGDNVDYPWQITSWVAPVGATFSNLAGLWTGAGADDDANWEVIGTNTFELKVSDIVPSSGTPGIAVNGVTLVAGATTTIGWVKEGDPVLVSANGATGIANAGWSYRDPPVINLNGENYANGGIVSGWDSSVGTGGVPVVLESYSGIGWSGAGTAPSFTINGIPSRASVTIQIPWIWGF